MCKGETVPIPADQVPAMYDIPSPFFVVGAQRSGTTLLRLMLNNHPALHVPFESRFIPDLARDPDSAAPLDDMRTRRLLQRIGEDAFVRKGRLLPDPDAVHARRPATYAGLVDAMFMHLARVHGKSRWGDKTPSYVLEMETLWGLFPGARFIHLVRDGRDVALSLRGVSWGSRDLLRVAQDWRWKVTLGRKLGAMMPGRYLELRYEALVQDPAPVLRRICAFLGEDYAPEMLDYHRRAEAEMPVESLQWHRSSVLAPDAAKAGAWRRAMGRADQRVFDDAAGDLLADLGYERSQAPCTVASRVRFARYALFGHA
jgi:hypothetical protein